MPGPRSAKKAQTPPKSAAKKAKGQRYEYVELGKASLSSVEAQNVYGVVIDATFPYKVNSKLYVCSLKIVDPSLNTSGKGRWLRQRRHVCQALRGSPHCAPHR